MRTNKLFIAVLILTMLNGCSDSVSSTEGTDFSGKLPDSANGNNNSASNNTNNNGALNFSKTSLLADLTDNVFVPTIQNFNTLSQNQANNVTEYCADLKTNSIENDELKLQAQQAWRDSMTSWQKLEVMQVGPLASNDNFLRNQIYSWPVASQCAVDQDVGHYEKGDISGTQYDITKRTSTRKGLDALEYLLFAPSLDHSCASDNFAPANWNQRADIERKIARCEFAVAVADDIKNSAQSLEDQWLIDAKFTTESGSYVNILKSLTADNGNGEFENIDSAINHITDALFYIDKITKDAKIGAPVGLQTNSCGTATCVKDAESTLSNHSLQNLKANLEGMLMVFEGTEPTSQIAFDDYLTAVDAESIATTMKADITAAIMDIESFNADYEDAIQNDPAKVQALFQKVKIITDNLKSTFITFLSLQLPSSSAGDAD